ARACRSARGPRGEFSQILAPLLDASRFGGTDQFRVDGVSIRIMPSSATMAGLQPNGDTEPAPSVTPNPMRTGGHLAFTTSRVGSIILRVFDAHGRVEGSLLDHSPTPGGMSVPSTVVAFPLCRGGAVRT